MRKRYWLLLSTLLFGAALLFVERYTHQASDRLVGEDTDEAEFFGEQLINRYYNREGRLQQTIIASQSASYPQRQVTEFILPEIATTDDQGQDWHIRSEHGHLNETEQQLHFKQQVIVRSLDDHNPMRLTTDFLLYHVDQQHANTDEWVRLQSRDSETTAIGLHLDIPQQHLQLHSEVTTRHVPVSRPE
ncbi:MAG: LPS export ABC transporter periplasmic protein LptC [Bacterioplanes sp.]|nr:LPS export ABC transporter periplasmic protein LptC [Bacterioplanes sp.]